VTTVQTGVPGTGGFRGFEPSAARGRSVPPRSTGWRRVRVAVVVVAAVVLVVGAARSVPVTPTPSGERGPATAFAVENLQAGGSPVSLGDYGGTPVVLNFWASWCTPCRRELEAFGAVSEQTRGEVAFIALNTRDDSRAAALKLLAATGVRFPSGYDPDGHLASAYELRGLPTTVFVSSDGRILAHHTGAMRREELEATIARLFRTDRVTEKYYTGSE
jgi:cytochrome c biogenesis protein CcmG/thiol:disulfide interchange protein DsbE